MVPREIGERPAGLFDDDEQGREIPERDGRLGRDVRRALGHEDVAPEVAEAAGAPHPLGERVELRLEPELGPPLEVAVAELRVFESADLGHADRRTIGERAAATHRPPGVAEGRRRADADAHLAVLLEREQRRPDRDAADVVLGPVDRVDDPTPVRGPLGAELLAQQRIPGAGGDQPVPDELLGRRVGLGDGRQVGLGLHLQVVGAEASERDLVGEGHELEGESQIGVDAGTLAGRCHRLGCTVGHAGNDPRRCWCPDSRSSLSCSSRSLPSV